MKPECADESWTAKLFVKPDYWGLRGDPYLWAELEEALSAFDKPTTSDGFELLINRVMQRLGIDLEGDVPEQYIDRYPTGGMSGGYVDLKRWRDSFIPMLLSRFAES